MQLFPITLGAGLALLVAASVGAQDASAPPSDTAEAPAPAADEMQKSSFTEAFSEPTATPSEPVEPPAIATEDVVAPADEAAPATTATPSPASEEAVGEEAVPRKGEPPTKEFMAGVWAEEGKSCATALDFKPDGKLIGPFPRWELEGGVLTLVGSRQKIMLTVLDKNTMQSRRSETDPPRILKRC
jgi:hypothetical protein